jgi:hypothetical protein
MLTRVGLLASWKNSVKTIHFSLCEAVCRENHLRISECVFAYRNGVLNGSPRAGNKDCTTVAAAPVLPVGYVVNASRIADRRLILAGYRLADLLARLNFD